MKLAIFDFDGTLYKKETFALLMEELKHHPTYNKRYRSFFRAALIPYMAYKAKLFSEEKMKYEMMQKYIHAFKGVTSYEMDRFFQIIASKMMQDINEAVAQKLKDHANDGMKILIVSGAFTPLVAHFTKDLPVDTIIATNIPYKNGVYNEYEKIIHVQGKTKKKLIEDFTKQKPIDWQESYAYGDSYSDLPVLNLVGNPICVQPDERLLQYAKAHHWEIINEGE